MRILRGRAQGERFLNKLRGERGEELEEVSRIVGRIIRDVRRFGDRAVRKYSKKYDGVSPRELRVSPRTLGLSLRRLDAKWIEALRAAKRNLERFHRAQLRGGFSIRIARGAEIGQIPRPLKRIGGYIPGGRRPYPSSMLMCAVPALAAGVKEVAICTPPGEGGRIHDSVLAAAEVCGVREVYGIGGAQAIAALAYGTESVEKVDKIIGPGNIYVTIAKLLVRDDVAVDLPAGPSEIAIIADSTANPRFVAADLLAQAEHGPTSLALLLTDSKALAEAVGREIEEELGPSADRAAAEAIRGNGAIVILKGIGECVAFANAIAPEHLEIMVKEPRALLGSIENAGAVFLGDYSPVALGDYSAGLNHILPTHGFAKYYSGLSSLDFVRWLNYLECSKEGFERLCGAAIELAEIEGFRHHSKSIRARLEGDGGP
ncbi:MAG: histidinol dehydrogenase [Candidatus Bathyarchaeia archaeon]